LLSRFVLDAQQATRFYQPTERKESGIEATDDDLLANPYLLYELDRHGSDHGPEPRVAFGTIDRGMFPEEIVRSKHPIPAPSALEDAIDARRVRALTVDTLESATAQGHTLLPRDWLIKRVRDREMRPACPLDEDTLAVCEGTFEEVVVGVRTASGSAFQLDRYVEAREIIAKAVRDRAKGKRHVGKHDWRGLVDEALKGAPGPRKGEDGLEETARKEKAAALEEVFGARVSVLIGSAGTGKTTLLRVLCAMPSVREGGILLLAPTGKARVRLEEQTGMRGRGKTIAQFLLPLGRYDARTGGYVVTGSSRRSAEHKTVIVDECSMLTEAQLAALLDGMGGVQRLVLVGDPRQLPPIGAGRPFVDIVRELAPVDAETRFPRVGPCYGELTIPRRQTSGESTDVQLAQWFSGSPCDAAADEIWNVLARGGTERLEVVSWASSEDLEEKLVAKLVEELELDGPEDESGFEQSLGGTHHQGSTFFWAGRNGEPGAAKAADAWQILSPVRAQLHGVDALNRRIQARFRQKARGYATHPGNRPRRVPKPMGPQEILYGDKVIQVVNQSRDHVWPRRSERLYLANGDIGIVVGEFKTKTFPGKPKNLEVEFTSESGTKVKYFAREFGDDGASPLELAYALTVHKAQGSEFKLTFVILPNPCRLLSRELLYTALTRQQDKVVVFHQGELRDLRKYSAPERSDVAQRLTNLFDVPSLVEQRLGTRTVWFEEGLIHRTERGDLVRSKSELVIANALHQRGIDYHFEKPVLFPDGSERLPDFTIENDATGETVFWEHLGLLHDRAYRKRWERKLAGYRSLGVLPWEQGGGEKGMLVTTRDDPGGGFDSQALAKLIKDVFGG
jgi:ATP-dependent exoDNAse (exonuclease V) alpha subunit